MRNRTPQGAEKELAKASLDLVDQDRRQALKKVGRFAVYVAPAMTVLLKGDSAGAHHKPTHDGGGGLGRCRKKPWLSIC